MLAGSLTRMYGCDVRRLQERRTVECRRPGAHPSGRPGPNDVSAAPGHVRQAPRTGRCAHGEDP